MTQGIVDRCVCMELSFAALAKLAQREGLDFEALKAKTKCCTGCHTCEPYVRLMLKTGQTRFAVLPVNPEAPEPNAESGTEAESGAGSSAKP